MLLYYGVLIKISNMHAAAGGQSIGKYLTKHGAADNSQSIQEENIVSTLLTVSRGNAKIEQELILQHHTIKSMQY